MKAPEFAFTIAGTRYDVNVGDLTPADARDFRNAVGIPVMEALRQQDLDVLAGWVWLVRRRAKPALTYAEVCGSFTYQDFFDSVDGDEEEVEPAEDVSDPPA